jgi:hypothetical protein
VDHSLIFKKIPQLVVIVVIASVKVFSLFKEKNCSSVLEFGRIQERIILESQSCNQVGSASSSGSNYCSDSGSDPYGLAHSNSKKITFYGLFLIVQFYKYLKFCLTEAEATRF